MVPQPAAPYGASKLAGEGYGHAFAGSYGMQVTALRFSNVYGPRSYRKGSAVAHFFKQIHDRQPITVYGDGSQVRDFVFGAELCQGILQAIDAEVSGVFQLGSVGQADDDQRTAGRDEAGGGPRPMARSALCRLARRRSQENLL
jgi:UDP-glucose 4-epimerase